MYNRHKINLDLYLIDAIRQFIRNTDSIISGKHACEKHLEEIHLAIVDYLR